MSAVDQALLTLLDSAGHEALRDRSATIEAHHLLLAIAAEEGGEEGGGARGVLEAAGLDHDALRAALDREFDHSLGAAGVSRAAFDLPTASPSPGPRLPMGASLRLAMERGLSTASRKKHVRTTHVLLGVLMAEFGTVPRALALAGVERDELIARVQETLSE